MRSVDVSEITKTGKLETVGSQNSPIKIGKIIRIVYCQVGITGTMINLYCNGTPVKDSPNSRGELLVKSFLVRLFSKTLIDY